MGCEPPMDWDIVIADVEQVGWMCWLATVHEPGLSFVSIRIYGCTKGRAIAKARRYVVRERIKARKATTVDL